MKIETMEPGAGIPRPSAMERITAVADVKGAERRQRILSRFDRILGAPEAVGEAAKIAGENTEAFLHRIEERLTETANDLTERAGNAFDRFKNRVTDTKDKAIAKAKDLGNRALRAGLTAGTWVENKVVAVCEVPAGMMEGLAGSQERKVIQTAGQLSEKLIEQATAQASLTTEQQAVLRSLLAAQEAQQQKLEAKQGNVREKLQGRIDQGREKATELRADAAGVRAKVESKRIFKGMLAKVAA